MQNVYSLIFINSKIKKKIFYNKLLPSGKITNQLLKNYSIGILTVLIERELLLKYKFNPKYNIIMILIFL